MGAGKKQSSTDAGRRSGEVTDGQLFAIIATTPVAVIVVGIFNAPRRA